MAVDDDGEDDWNPSDCCCWGKEFEADDDDDETDAWTWVELVLKQQWKRVVESVDGADTLESRCLVNVLAAGMCKATPKGQMELIQITTVSLKRPSILLREI